MSKFVYSLTETHTTQLGKCIRKALLGRADRFKIHCNIVSYDALGPNNGIIAGIDVLAIGIEQKAN